MGVPSCRLRAAMPGRSARRNLHPLFTAPRASRSLAGASAHGQGKDGLAVAGLALILFVALFAFGGQYFGWPEAGGRIQLALFCAFIFGVICGLKLKG